MFDSMPDIADRDVLIKRAERDGYLFFRGLLPPDDVLEVRRNVLRVMDRHGRLVPGQDDLGGRIESVHALAHHPALIALYKRLFDAPVLVHPRHIVRTTTSHPPPDPTPPDQDFQASSTSWTCWLPLGDCARENGSLTVLRQSPLSRYLPMRFTPGADGAAAQLGPAENEWREADFSAGDVLTFYSYTVHKALPSATPDVIRLSMEVRYQGAVS